jgi:hypothetical protein
MPYVGLTGKDYVSDQIASVFHFAVPNSNEKRNPRKN